MNYGKVGQIALRRPDGSFSEAIDIYKDLDEKDAAVAERTGRELAEIVTQNLEKLGVICERIKRRTTQI